MKTSGGWLVTYVATTACFGRLLSSARHNFRSSCALEGTQVTNLSDVVGIVGGRFDEPDGGRISIHPPVGLNQRGKIFLAHSLQAFLESSIVPVKTRYVYLPLLLTPGHCAPV